MRASRALLADGMSTTPVFAASRTPAAGLDPGPVARTSPAPAQVTGRRPRLSTTVRLPRGREGDHVARRGQQPQRPGVQPGRRGAGARGPARGCGPVRSCGRSVACSDPASHGRAPVVNPPCSDASQAIGAHVVPVDPLGSARRPTGHPRQHRGRTGPALAQRIAALLFRSPAPGRSGPRASSATASRACGPCAVAVEPVDGASGRGSRAPSRQQRRARLVALQRSRKARRVATRAGRTNTRPGRRSSPRYCDLRGRAEHLAEQHAVGGRAGPTTARRSSRGPRVRGPPVGRARAGARRPRRRGEGAAGWTGRRGPS